MVRIQFINFLKGIGIILVVYGHVEFPFSQLVGKKSLINSIRNENIKIYD
jgi:fucose 4-O-acetylase-like acetyltransferase